MRVDQVLSAAGLVDAVTNQALAWHSLFRQWGWEGEVFSATREPDVRRQLRPLAELDPSRADVVVIHYSGYADGLDSIADPRSRILLISHNVTPAEWFWAHEPVEGVRCQLAREQLIELAPHAHVLAGVSEFNAQELREATGRQVEVIPVLFDRRELGPAGHDGNGRTAASAPEILFVGRLAPHKRQDLVIRAFAAYRRRRPDARLTLVGTPLSPGYCEQLTRLADALAPGAVTFHHGLSQTELVKRYRQADLFLCLSEHEGFCIPLLESFHFGLPVVARDAGAVGEVLDGAGVLLDSEDDLATIAAAVEVVIGDPELQAELRARGERRLGQYDVKLTAGRMQALLQAIADGVLGDEVPGGELARPEDQQQTAHGE